MEQAKQMHREVRVDSVASNLQGLLVLGSGAGRGSSVPIS